MQDKWVTCGYEEGRIRKGMFGVNIEKLKKKRDIDGLIRALLTDKKWEKRRSAAWALGDLNVLEAIEPLGKAIIDEYQEVRIAIVHSLMKFEGDRPFELLCLALTDSSYYVRRALAGALESYGEREPLTKLLNDNYKEVRETAEICLEKYRKNHKLSGAEDLLKKQFGVTNVGHRTHSKAQWGYSGKGSDIYAHELNQPEACLTTLRELKSSNAKDFDKICIISGTNPYIVLNTKPPYALVISLDGEEIIDLIKLMADEYMEKKQPIISLEGAYILDMP
jgi:hypothetical protein